MNSVKLIVVGKVPSKTSKRKQVYNSRTGVPMNIRSDAAMDYEDYFLPQVQYNVKRKFAKEDRHFVTLVVYDTGRRQDIDSFPKTVFDCLQKSEVIVNDNRIDDMRVIRRVDKDNPRVEINVMKPAADNGVHTMICSRCGSMIATKQSGLFDIFDCSWTCPVCYTLWLSSDGWKEIGNLLIPYRGENE